MVVVQALQERWATAMWEDATGVSFVFCDSDGKPLRKSNFERRVWKLLRKASGLSQMVRFHDLRHTSASWLLKAGDNPKTFPSSSGMPT